MSSDRPDRPACATDDGPADVARIVRFFETLTPAALARLDDIYHPRCRFKDPFHDVQGLEAVRAVYAHMYGSLQAPRFVVTRRFAHGRECVLLWDFVFAFRRRPARPQCIRGCSHLVLDGDGRIVEHRDYWDAAEELYEKLPLLGGLMRALKRRARA